MKKLISIIMLCYISIAFTNAQIALEHTYDSTNFSDYSGLYKIQLEDAGSKYVAVNNNLQHMVIYNLDHTVYKTINIAMNNFLVLYVSDHLFALDNKIEYIQMGDNGINNWIRIYNEDGIKLWEEQDSLGCTLLYHSADFMYPIFNTDSGAKLVVHIATSMPQVYKAKVYSLPGTLTTGNMELYENQFQEAMKIYPNPSSSQTTIEIDLPPGRENGEIIIYNLEGEEVKSIVVSSSEKKIHIDNASLSSGTYLYRLVSGDYSSSRKVIIIK